jgi:hypothetical protein
MAGFWCRHGDQLEQLALQVWLHDPEDILNGSKRTCQDVCLRWMACSRASTESKIRNKSEKEKKKGYIRDRTV